MLVIKTNEIADANMKKDSLYVGISFLFGTAFSKLLLLQPIIIGGISVIYFTIN